MTERLRRFHTFNSPEELVEYVNGLPEKQRATMEKEWDEYLNFSDEARKIGIEAEKRFWEVINPYLALNTFAFIEIFKGNAGLGLAAHAVGDILVVKTAVDRARKSTKPKVEALRKARGAFRTSGIEIRGVRDWLSALRLSRSLKFE